MANNAKPGVLDRRAQRQRPREQAVPPAVTGANIVALDVPDTAPATGAVTVRGRIHYNNLSRPLTNTPTRIRIVGPSIPTPIVQRLQNLSHCNRDSFAIDVPVPVDAGESFQLTVESQSRPVTWTTDETQGPFTVDALSQTQQTTKNALETAPWVLGGGAVGVGAARLSGRVDEQLAAGAIGSGVGLGAKLALDAQQGPILPRIGAIETVAIAAAVLGVGVLAFGDSDVNVDINDRLQRTRDRLAT